MQIKKLESKAEEERKKKRNQWILGIILVFILTGGVFGIVTMNFGSSGNNNPYGKSVIINNKEFVENQGFWITMNPEKNNQQLSFVYLPNQTSVDDEKVGNINIDYQGKTIYVDTNSTEVFYTIYRNFQNDALRIQRGCINQTNCQGDYPLKTCDDNIIITRESDEKYINQENNCIYISSPEQDILKTTEEFVYRYYNII